MRIGPARAVAWVAGLALFAVPAASQNTADPVAAETPASPAPEPSERTPSAALTAEPEPSPTPSSTATPETRDARLLGVEERRRELLALKRRLAELRNRYLATRKREADLKDRLLAAELNLQICTAERRVLELRRVDVERAVSNAVLLRDESARRVTTLRSDLALRVVALYRLGKLGYFRAIAAVESGPAFIRGLQALTFSAKRDAALLAAYESSLTTLRSHEENLTTQRRELEILVSESRRQEEKLTAARAEQAALYSTVHRTLESERIAVTTLEDKTTRLESLLELLEKRGSQLPKGAASIRKFKGALDWPAKGAVTVPFGRVANPNFPKTFLRSNGWTVDAPQGTEVHAVFSGDVVYAQWLKGYGNLVVLDHGEGVFTLYGRLLPGTATVGSRVALGDRVGRVGSASEDEIAGLYFEIREDRVSIDPRLWLR